MKNICFIGSFEKLDLILYIAKIIKDLGKEVLIVDSTEQQKAKYIVPTINPTRSYITRYDNIDIAIGFENYEEIEKYIGEIGEKIKYDYVLVNIDNPEIFSMFNNEDTIKNYFVTSFELYSIKRGLETISKIEKPIKISKIIFSNNFNEQDEYYLDYLSLGFKIIWNEEKIIFPYDTRDLEIMIDNQKIQTIKLNNLSQLYKESLVYIILDAIEEINEKELRKIMKNIEKE